VTKPLMSLTAADLMSRDLVLIPKDMSLQGAARMLSRGRVSGAPVVDETGQCIGVLSTTDFLRWVEDGKARHKANDAYCPSWQINGKESAVAETVARFMTTDPVVVIGSADIARLSQVMIDARIHRVIVIDCNNRPIGIVSSTDVLAAVARAGQSRDDAVADTVHDPVACR